jgi:hypothetical protein
MISNCDGSVAGAAKLPAHFANLLAQGIFHLTGTSFAASHPAHIRGIYAKVLCDPHVEAAIQGLWQ